ncbi:MAG: bacitracin resistance protein BacA [Selenomonadaceae bacterium]|nr:bacitracin resistance protein BacA [Selenomonadaceae bacterium]
MSSIGSVLNSSINHLNSANKTTNKYLQQIATGSKINSAADDPATYAITRRMQSRIGSVAQANANTQTSNAKLSVAAGGVDATVNALSSLREQLVNAANGTNSTTDLAALQESVNQTVATINENVSNSQYNGQTLLDGSQSVEVAGPDGFTTNLNLGDMSSTALGLTDAQGNSTINLTDSASINSALTTVDNALNSALEQATSIGAAQQGLTFQSSNYTVEEENLTAAETNMSGTNMAEAATKMKSAQAQEQLALFALKSGMQQQQQRVSALSLLS